MISQQTEVIMNALFTFLQNVVKISFTASGTNGTPNLTGITGSMAGFFAGLPVFGPGVPKYASILSFDPVAHTAVLDRNLTADSTAQPFATGFVYASRRQRLWQEQPDQPALFVRHLKNIDAYQGGSQQRTIMEVQCWIYSKAGADPDTPSDIQLNNLADAIRSAVKPDVRSFPQTLASVNGGKPLVQWVRIEGESMFDPGDLDDQGLALIPLRILCP